MLAVVQAMILSSSRPTGPPFASKTKTHHNFKFASARVSSTVAPSQRHAPDDQPVSEAVDLELPSPAAAVPPTFATTRAFRGSRDKLKRQIQEPPALIAPRALFRHGFEGPIDPDSAKTAALRHNRHWVDVGGRLMPKLEGDLVTQGLVLGRPPTKSTIRHRAHQARFSSVSRPVRMASFTVGNESSSSRLRSKTPTCNLRSGLIRPPSSDSFRLGCPSRIRCCLLGSPRTLSEQRLCISSLRWVSRQVQFGVAGADGVVPINRSPFHHTRHPTVGQGSRAR